MTWELGQPVLLTNAPSLRPHCSSASAEGFLVRVRTHNEWCAFVPSYSEASESCRCYADDSVLYATSVAHKDGLRMFCEQVNHKHNTQELGSSQAKFIFNQCCLPTFFQQKGPVRNLSLNSRCLVPDREQVAGTKDDRVSAASLKFLTFVYWIPVNPELDLKQSNKQINAWMNNK